MSGVDRRLRELVNLMACAGHTAAQLAHITHRLPSMVCSTELTHAALHSCSHLPQLMHRSGSISK